MNNFIHLLTATIAAEHHEFQNSTNFKGTDPDMKMPLSKTLDYSYDTDLKEPRRPKIHLSPYMMWMNDPNGLLKDPAGDYHVFYQHHPSSLTWNPMHWAHAKSSDLINWTHLPLALRPPHGNEHTRMKFSGSAVIDVANTAGFGEDAMVLIATDSTFDWVKSASENRKYEIQEQSISYSTDYIHFTDYEDNPVLPNPWMDAGRMAAANKNGNNNFPLTEGASKIQSIADQSGFDAFRDPNVVKVNDTWVMALSQNNHVEFWYSCNLKDWKLLQSYNPDTDKTAYGFGFYEDDTCSDGSNECKPISNKYMNSGRPSLGGAGGIGNHSGVFECPDLVAFEDPMDPSKELYYLAVSINPGGPNGGSITQYFIGDFDFVVDDTCEATGLGFIPTDTFDGQSNCDLLRHTYVDYGPDNYAGVTFHTSSTNDAEERSWMGWMSNWEYANNVPFDSWGRNQMTWPRTMALRATCAVDDTCDSSIMTEDLDGFQYPKYVMAQKPFSAESLYCSSTPWEMTNTSVKTEQELPKHDSCAGTQGVMEIEGTLDYEGTSGAVTHGDRIGIRLMTNATDIEGSIVFGYQKGISGDNAAKTYNSSERSQYFQDDLKCPVDSADWDARYKERDFFFVDRTHATRKVEVDKFGGEMGLTHALRHWENTGNPMVQFKAILDVNSIELFWDAMDDDFATTMQTVTFFNDMPFTHFRYERQRDGNLTTVEAMEPMKFNATMKIHPLKDATFTDGTGYNVEDNQSSCDQSCSSSASEATKVTSAIMSMASLVLF